MINLLDDSAIARARSGCTSALCLTFNGLKVRLLTNNPSILDYLVGYFSGLTDSQAVQKELRVFLIDGEPDTGAVDWTPVQRSKVSRLGLKEAYVDTHDGRWIHKVRTGLVMFQSLVDPVVMGDLLANRSQVVNFINNQFLNHYQRQGYLLGHASAFDIEGRTTAIAASSGGGKSTLMLKALETPGARFLSNDRILFKAEGGAVRVLGVAKHPRVNPGTLMHSERLRSILPAAEQKRFAGMPTGELWAIEQKYDVLIPAAYGDGKTALSGTLRNLVLLDWSLDDPAPTELGPVDIEQSPHALDGLRKSPGPFFQNAEGVFPPEQSPAADVYADRLPGVQVLQLTGRVDFDRAVELLHQWGLL
ncbi:HprK-related kinase B [Marinobacter bohaiensis]|uniref:HprK-related kinase B n=1 Tax=Marinobacter bohaiensis TaxID=2201898 RepID=UPI000DAB4CC8|nr:HprK-related kinase B [Marinobacter bohaiensis]